MTMQPDTAATSAAPEDSQGADLNCRLLVPLMRWLRERNGEEALLDVLLEAGLSSDVMNQGTAWISQAQFERALAAAYRHAGDDATFLQACAYQMAESYGPLRYLVRAATPATIHRQAARGFHLISRISRMYVEETDERHVRITYVTDRQESRLMCLSRQAQTAAGPTLWDMPRARVHERACVTRGDPACVYDVELYAHRRILPSVVGLVAGGALGGLLTLLGIAIPFFVLALLGFVAGYAHELARVHRANLRTSEEQNEVLRVVANEEAEARAEIVALHKRQRQWTMMLEEQISDRTEAVQAAVVRLRRLAEARVQTLHGVSKDPDSPLQTLRRGIVGLSESGAQPAKVAEMEAALEKLGAALHELTDQLAREKRTVPFSPARVDVRELTEALRRRLRALAFGTGVEARVYCVREAPDAIACDPMLLDRILDHLLANAARYTDRGSITVEVSGSPGHLVIKIADTGRGIDPYDLKRLLGVVDNPEPSRQKGSGLNVVVDLLEEIGGRLEVMSQLEVGSTFWVHVPVEPLAGTDARPNVVTLLSAG
jgi:signal transduction histidine kinase